LDFLIICGVLTKTEVLPGKEMLLRVVAMLSKMTANASHVKEEVSNDYEHEHEHEHDNGTR